MVGKFISRGICAAFTAAAVAGNAPAQEAEQETQDEARLGTISVTATRNPISAFEFPGMVSVIDRAEIEFRQPSTVDDILQFIPNVEFYGGPRRTGEVPSIRGFSGADVVVMLDGARQNFGSTHDGRFFLDPSLLRSAEVLRGSSSSLYGSGGTGGVIEFRTIDAADLLTHGQTLGASVTAGYQAVNSERLASASVYALPAHGIDLVGAVTKRDSGTIRLGDGSKLRDTDDDIIAGLAKVSATLGEHHRLEGSFVGFNNQAEEPNNGQGIGDTTAEGMVEKDIRSNTLRAAYSFSDPSNALIDLDVIAYRTDMQADEFRLDDLGIGPEGETIRRDVETIGARLDNRTRFMLSDGLAATFTYGAEHYRDTQDGAAGAGERDGVPDAKARFTGLFAQAEITLSEPLGALPGDLLVIPGVRHDAFKMTSPLGEDVDESEVSPRIGVSYLPTDWLLMFANYGEAFRAPTFNEIYLTGTHFVIPLGPRNRVINRFVANPDLKPQKTQTFEIGGGLSFDGVSDPEDRLEIKASRFWIEGEDFIDIAVDQPDGFGACFAPPQFQPPFCNIPGFFDGTTYTSNVTNAKLQGTEIEASYENARIRLAMAFSSLDGNDKDTGAKLGVLTPNQIAIDGAVKLPEFNSIAGWRVLAAERHDKVNDPVEERAGYAAHDIYYSWQAGEGALKGLRVNLGVDNLFDKAYARVFTDSLEPGRNFKASFSYSATW